MRLLSTNQTSTFVVPDEINKETGKPVKGATKWFFRPLTSGEEGIMQDSMFDFAKLSVKTDGNDDDKAEVGGMDFATTPSERRTHRIRLSLVGWENLEDSEGNHITYEAEEFLIGGTTVKGAPGAVIDALPMKYLIAMERFLTTLNSVEIKQGNG